MLSRDEILIFDRWGKGTARINRYGQGGEEYLSL
ncbi:6-bladed beta-propeller [Phocaeicola coprophilus]